jgi:hypothetical protein
LNGASIFSKKYPKNEIKQFLHTLLQLEEIKDNNNIFNVFSATLVKSNHILANPDVFIFNRNNINECIIVQYKDKVYLLDADVIDFQQRYLYTHSGAQLLFINTIYNQTTGGLLKDENTTITNLENLSITSYQQNLIAGAVNQYQHDLRYTKAFAQIRSLNKENKIKQQKSEMIDLLMEEIRKKNNNNE